MKIRPLAIALLLVAATTPCVKGEVLPLECTLIATGFYYYHDLAVDPAGWAHAYLDETSIDQLFYLNNEGGAWSAPEFVHATSDWGSINVSGAAGSDGSAHVAFDGGRGGRPNDSFFYGTNRGGSWACSLVLPNMRWYALDLGPSPAELPRAAYYDNYSGLNYATMAPDQTWTYENVDNSGGVTTYAGRYPDLFVDDDDLGHICYYYYVDKDIRYATNALGGWQWEVVVSDPNIGSKSWITVAPDGTPIVNYHIGDRIWIARRSGGTWEHIPVTGPGNYGQSDVKADASGLGRAIVVYSDLTANRLMLAIEGDGQFEHYEIADLTAGGDGPILQVRDGLVHVLAWVHAAGEAYYLVGELPPVCAVEAERPAMNLRLTPNPITDAGALRMSLPVAGPVAVLIVDAAGRQVWQWSRARVPQGELRLAWPACDHSGRPLPAGAYYCAVRTPQGRSAHVWRVIR